MRLPNEPDLPPKINILPMIDVIFAILVFFIVSSLFLTRSEGLPVSLPQAKTAQLQKTEQIVVSLDRDGNLSIGDKSVQLHNLKTEMEKLIKTKPKTIVIIKADEAINHGQVVEVMDLLRQIPDLKLAIAAKQKNTSTPNK